MHWAVWIIGGIALIIAEMVLPGLIAVFLGVGAIITGALVFFGWLQDITTQLVCWVVTSGLFFFLLREQIIKYFPALEKKDSLTEDQTMSGKIVEVIEDIIPGKPGRVHVQQSSWRAMASVPLQAGTKVRIVSRDNLMLTVEPIDPPAI